MWISPIPQIKFRNFLFFFEDKRWDSRPDMWLPRSGMWEEAAQTWFTLNFAEMGSTMKGRGEWVHMHGVSPHIPYAERQCGCSVLPCLLWLSFPLALSWEAAYGEGMILENMFDEVKDIFSCVSVWLWLTVSINGEESSHYGEAVGWEEKVGRRPASLQGDGRPSFTGRTCRTTADEPLLKTCKGNSPP